MRFISAQGLNQVATFASHEIAALTKVTVLVDDHCNEIVAGKDADNDNKTIRTNRNLLHITKTEDLGRLAYFFKDIGVFDNDHLHVDIFIGRKELVNGNAVITHQDSTNAATRFDNYFLQDFVKHLLSPV